MKNDKKLIEIFNNAKNQSEYYTFEDFKKGVKNLLKDMKKRNVYCSTTVSKSGMTRHFGFIKEYNAVLNIVYNDKLDFEAVKVGGCGMDMGFHLLYTFYSAVLTKKEIEAPVKVSKTFTSSWNSLASDYRVI